MSLLQRAEQLERESPQQKTVAGNLRFREEHLEAFSRLSYDVNPLHRNEAYARRTPFGERVIFGVASVLTLLGVWAGGRPFRLRRLEAQFRKPLFVGREYV